MIKSKAMPSLMPLASEIKTRGANLYHNAKTKRVSHTIATLKLLIRAVTRFRFEVEDHNAYVRTFSHALFQSQVSAIEVEPHSDGTIFIRGAFNVDQLRIYLLVNNPVDTITLDVAGPETDVADANE